MVEKKKVFLIDSSAIFSGKPLSFIKDMFVTTSKINDEFKPGGRDFRNFQLLIDKGLQIIDPSKSSINSLLGKVKLFGEEKRLSDADISILALAYEYQKSGVLNPIIVSDDYSIQNVANHLEMTIQTINQKAITKRFKWERRCRGCRKKIIEDVDVCPICGSSIKHVIKKSSPVKKQK